MAITREEVLHVARLARLSLSEAEAERLRGQLSAFLDYVKQLDRLDTRDVAPTSHAIETGTPFRDDVVEPFGDREALLANAPDRKNDSPQGRERHGNRSVSRTSTDPEPIFLKQESRLLKTGIGGAPCRKPGNLPDSIPRTPKRSPENSLRP